MTLEHLGALLRTCREASGLSQEELGKMIHINRTTVGKIEAGKTAPSVEAVIAWARATSAEGIISAFLSEQLGGEEQRRALNEVIRAVQEIAPAVQLLVRTG